MSGLRRVRRQDCDEAPGSGLCAADADDVRQVRRQGPDRFLDLPGVQGQEGTSLFGARGGDLFVVVVVVVFPFQVPEPRVLVRLFQPHDCG